MTVLFKVPETMGCVSSRVDPFEESNIRKPLKATFTESNPDRSRAWSNCLKTVKEEAQFHYPGL